jgi:hypothetical protein
MHPPAQIRPWPRLSSCVTTVPPAPANLGRDELPHQEAPTETAFTSIINQCSTTSLQPSIIPGKASNRGVKAYAQLREPNGTWVQLLRQDLRSC